MDDRAKRDVASYWKDFADGIIPLRDLNKGKRHHGFSDSGLPSWFTRAMRKDWSRREILDLCNIAWMTCRGHIDSYKRCLQEIVEECYRDRFSSRQHLHRLIWRNQKRRYREWVRTTWRTYSTSERGRARIGQLGKMAELRRKPKKLPSISLGRNEIVKGEKNMVFLADVQHGEQMERFATENPAQLVETLLKQPEYAQPDDLIIYLEKLKQSPGKSPGLK